MICMYIRCKKYIDVYIDVRCIYIEMYSNNSSSSVYVCVYRVE